MEKYKGQFFNEIYGTYYNTMAVVIEAARQGNLDDEKLFEIVRENSFSESVVPITDAIREERWQIVNSDFKTNIKNKPEMPLTNLQKRFLKSMVLDKRAKLFFSDEEMLELEKDLVGVEPIFNPSDVERFDKYADGDEFENPDYIKNFRTVLHAIYEKKCVRITGIGKNGTVFTFMEVPNRLEYSAKDDKFRICFSGKSKHSMVNMAKVRKVEICENDNAVVFPNRQSVDNVSNPDFLPDCNLSSARNTGNEISSQTKKPELVLEVTDERNALDRVLINFSHLKKSCERIDGQRYRLTMEFDESDVAEMVIRVLQFGPYVKAVKPAWFVERIKEKLRKQRRLLAV